MKTIKQIKKAFRDEFGIHFKDCKGELQFADQFIEEVYNQAIDNMDKEVCIVAAVRSTTGKIYRGHRHSDCIKAITSRHFIPDTSPLSQGFITSKNRYVDRAEGYELQIKAGIKSANTEFCQKNGYCQEGQLYSEDLY